MASNREDALEGTSSDEVSIPRQGRPLSSTLARSNSGASAPGADVLDDDEDADSEKDIVAEKESPEESWDPLQHQPLEVQLEEDEPFVAARGGQLYEAGDSVVDVNGRVVFHNDVKPSRSNLQLEIEPRPLQPWDLVDPPSTNREKPPNSYGTVNSQKFSALQESTRSRSLIPKSSYYFGPPPPGSAYGTSPIGQIGLHHPREIIRVERDYTGGELIQFAPIYPLELEGRITPTQFLESINSINELLISAHSFRHAMIDNFFSVFTLQISAVLFETHYDREMKRLQQLFDELNTDLYNPSGLNLLWPQKVAFLFLEIEYY
ncbi:Golgin subfamily A member 7/ERF4 family-domain-containing protein [Lentinula aff. detonsa]|uniref:Ras modification protein ERF4 n=1 Tax=Lentinula aff. detonsa TaxID=2804958 RepID=A0AA38NRF5_9AGAR|nr:Golgin subfamily A member 7/ERF4 family-domain-containing protein [Lentinula aff. detonsa]